MILEIPSAVNKPSPQNRRSRRFCFCFLIPDFPRKIRERCRTKMLSGLPNHLYLCHDIRTKCQINYKAPKGIAELQELRSYSCIYFFLQKFQLSNKNVGNPIKNKNLLREVSAWNLREIRGKKNRTFFGFKVWEYTSKLPNRTTTFLNYLEFYIRTTTFSNNHEYICIFLTMESKYWQLLLFIYIG